MFRALVATLTAPTSATTVFGRVRHALRLAPLRQPPTEKSTAPAPVAPPARAALGPCAASVASAPPAPRTDSLQTAPRAAVCAPDQLPHVAMVHNPVPNLPVAGAGLPPPGLESRAPNIPAAGPLWPGDPNIVPEPGALRGSVAMASAAFAAGQLWMAVAGTYAAQVRSTNAEREQLASLLRGTAWKTAFMVRHHQHFARNPGGALTAEQFHLGFWAVPAVRALAFAELSDPVAPLAWFPWLDWGPGLRAGSATYGYCYLHLVDPVHRARAADQLGAWPEADDLAAWFEVDGLAPPGPFYVIGVAPLPGGVQRWHVVPDGTAGARRAWLPRAVWPDGMPPDTLPPTDRLGGDPLADAGANRLTHEVRWILSAALNRRIVLSESPRLRDLARTWRSVRLESVEARLVGDEAGSTLYVGIASTATAPAATADGTVAANAAFECDAYGAVDAFVSSVGRVALEVAVPDHIRREFSVHAPAVGAAPPVLVINLDTAGATTAVVTLRLTVGGGALAVATGGTAL